MTPGNHDESNGNGARRRASKGTLRQVNDTIRELAGRTASGESWEFICECDDLACFELVPLTLGEFDTHRNGGGGTPILAQHHAVAPTGL